MKTLLCDNICLFLLVALLTGSCTSDEDVYDEAANTILQNYGGELAYGEGLGVGVGSKGNKYNYLSVELSNSEILLYDLSPDLVMTHIAAEFSKVVPSGISEIQVELSSLPSGNGPMDFSLTIAIEEAKLVNDKEEILHSCIDRIASNNVSKLTELFIDEYNNWFTNNDGEKVLSEINTWIGDYQGSVFRGYELVRNDSIPDKDFILINGLMLGTNENAIISVIIDPEISTGQSIVAIRY